MTKWLRKRDEALSTKSVCYHYLILYAALSVVHGTLQHNANGQIPAPRTSQLEKEQTIGLKCRNTPTESCWGVHSCRRIRVSANG